MGEIGRIGGSAQSLCSSEDMLGLSDRAFLPWKNEEILDFADKGFRKDVTSSVGLYSESQKKLGSMPAHCMHGVASDDVARSCE